MLATATTSCFASTFSIEYVAWNLTQVNINLIPYIFHWCWLKHFTKNVVSHTWHWLLLLSFSQTPPWITDHPLSTYAKFSEKLTFLTPWYAHVRIHTYLLLEMAIHSPILIRISCAEFVRCHFSGSVFWVDIYSRSCNTLFKFMLVEWEVLPSA